MLTCLACRVEFADGTQHPSYRRWCSYACYLRAWKTRRAGGVARSCVLCGVAFTPSVHATRMVYCSHKCRDRVATAKRRGKALVQGLTYDQWIGKRAPSPLEWDGVTQLSVQPDLKYRYEGHCLLCGGVAYLYVTEYEARRLRARRCPRCQGRVFVERSDIGTISSVRRARIGVVVAA